MNLSSTLPAALLAVLLASDPSASAAPRSATQAVVVSAQCNPFLAGQPAGTTSKTDTAPAQSPLLVPLSGQPGTSVRFPSVTGGTSYTPGHAPYPPEGGFLESSTPDLGISGYTMPICALLGVFLPATTNSGAAPPNLDFSTPASREFTWLAPELYQIFFIGDGQQTGGTLQSFAVPAGATRLYLGICDGFQWHDNSGSFSVEIEGLPPVPCNVVTYCTPKINSLGCTPAIGFTGSPSMSGPDEFLVTASNVCNYRAGMLLWGRAPASIPYQGGYLCVAAPRHRTYLQDSGGNMGVEDCSGSYEFQIGHAFLSATGLGIGDRIYAQFWCRDPGSLPFASGFTDALEFPICP